MTQYEGDEQALRYARLTWLVAPMYAVHTLSADLVKVTRLCLVQSTSQMSRAVGSNA